MSNSSDLQPPNKKSKKGFFFLACKKGGNGFPLRHSRSVVAVQYVRRMDSDIHWFLNSFSQKVFFENNCSKASLKSITCTCTLFFMRICIVILFAKFLSTPCFPSDRSSPVRTSSFFSSSPSPFSQGILHPLLPPLSPSRPLTPVSRTKVERENKNK